MSAATKINGVDLSGIEIPELKQLGAAVSARIDQLERERREAAFKAIEALAKERGLSKADLAERYAGTRARRSAPSARYRNPANASETWNGRGRRPQWVERHLDAGGTLAQLEATT